MQLQNNCHRTTKRRRRQCYNVVSSTNKSTNVVVLILSSLSSKQYNNYYYAYASCDPCIIGDEFVQIPDTNCQIFAQCNGGRIAQQFTCQSGLIYDSVLNQCNWANLATCNPDPLCPTPSPSKEPISSPGSAIPTSHEPTEHDGKGGVSKQRPSSSSSNSINIPSLSATTADFAQQLQPIRYPHHMAIWAHVSANKVKISNHLLQIAYSRLSKLYGTDNINTDQIRNYMYDDFYNAITSMSEQGYVIPTSDSTTNRGNNVELDMFGNEQSRSTFYLGETTHSMGDAAVIGLVNIALFLSQSMADSISQGSCDEVNQVVKTNTFTSSTSCEENSYQDMRCSVECPIVDTETNPCWYGRGTIQTRGRCQYGKLNYYLGSKAAKDGRPSRYPGIDFCAKPETVCSIQYTEIEWITGLFQWIDRVQSYDGGGWNYIVSLNEFVAGNMIDDSFVYTVSAIVTQGSMNSDVEIQDSRERWSYFLQALDAFGLPVKALHAGYI